MCISVGHCIRDHLATCARVPQLLCESACVMRHEAARSLSSPKKPCRASLPCALLCYSVSGMCCCCTHTCMHACMPRASRRAAHSAAPRPRVRSGRTTYVRYLLPQLRGRAEGPLLVCAWPTTTSRTPSSHAAAAKKHSQPPIGPSRLYLQPTTWRVWAAGRLTRPSLSWPRSCLARSDGQPRSIAHNPSTSAAITASVTPPHAAPPPPTGPQQQLLGGRHHLALACPRTNLHTHKSREGRHRAGEPAYAAGAPVSVRACARAGARLPEFGARRPRRLPRDPQAVRARATHTQSESRGAGCGPRRRRRLAPRPPVARPQQGFCPAAPGGRFGPGPPRGRRLWPPRRPPAAGQEEEGSSPGAASLLRRCGRCSSSNSRPASRHPRAGWRRPAPQRPRTASLVSGGRSERDAPTGEREGNKGVGTIAGRERRVVGGSCSPGSPLSGCAREWVSGIGPPSDPTWRASRGPCWRVSPGEPSMMMHTSVKAVGGGCQWVAGAGWGPGGSLPAQGHAASFETLRVAEGRVGLHAVWCVALRADVRRGNARARERPVLRGRRRDPLWLRTGACCARVCRHRRLALMHTA